MHVPSTMNGLKIARLMALASAIGLAGCSGGGRSVATISGEVAVNGEPLQRGKIVYRPVENDAGNGGSADVALGRYQLEEVPLGDNVFTFSGSVETGKTIVGPGGNPEPERANVIPRKILEEGVVRAIDGDGTQDFFLEGPAR
ncbi:MAG: hypothetical protein KDA44_15205 [Planctomycetales bacterium]|nr:hypothetical protein [Planctomycetales bacterium]